MKKETRFHFDFFLFNSLSFLVEFGGLFKGGRWLRSFSWCLLVVFLGENGLKNYFWIQKISSLISQQPWWRSDSCNNRQHILCLFFVACFFLKACCPPLKKKKLEPIRMGMSKAIALELFERSRYIGLRFFFLWYFFFAISSFNIVQACWVFINFLFNFIL